MRANDERTVPDAADGGGAGVGSIDGADVGAEDGAWEVDADVGEARRAREAQGDLDGCAVGHPAGGGGGVGDGVGGDVCCGVEDDRARAQVAAAALLLLGWEERRIQAREAQIHGDGG